MAAWQKWSEAFDYLTPTNEDQYGPLRVGPAYPLIFQPNITRTMAKKEIAFPAESSCQRPVSSKIECHGVTCGIRTLFFQLDNVFTAGSDIKCV